MFVLKYRDPDHLVGVLCTNFRFFTQLYGILFVYN